jgi:hypothetical protein
MMDMDVVHELDRRQEKGSLVMSCALVVMFIGMIIMGTRWPLRASLPVYFIAGLGLLLVALQIGRDIYILRKQARTGQIPMAFTRAENILEFNAWLWLAGLVLSCWLIGFHITFFVYPLVFGYVYGGSLKNSLYISVSAVALLFMIFDFFVGAVWPNILDEVISGALMSIAEYISGAVRQLVSH